MCLTKLFDGKGKEHQLDSDKIGELARLKTNAKGNLVEAVNEVNDRFPKVEEADNGKILRVENGRWAAVEQEESSFGAPMFDLGAMGMDAVSLPTGNSSVSGDMTPILTALNNGDVIFGVPVSMGGAEFTAHLTMQGFTDGTSYYQCTSLFMTEIVFFVVVAVYSGKVDVTVAPLSSAAGIPAVSSADNNKVMEVVNGVWTAVPVAESSVKTFVDEYISSALEGDY